MADDKQSVTIHGIGSHQIDIEALDHESRERLMDCIKKNGKISIMIGHGQSSSGATPSFAQQID